MTENVNIVNQGFRYLLKALAPYVARELQIEYKNDWWNEGVLNTLRDEQRKGLPEKGGWAELVDSLDIMRCLTLIDAHWVNVFKRKLSIDHRNWTKELIGIRHKCAHIGSQDFDVDYAWRALDTMARLCEQIDAESTEEIRTLIRKIRYGTSEASIYSNNGIVSNQMMNIDKSGVLSQSPLSGLPPWRYVIEPHPDVAQGRYKNAEFAADLAQVARGEGEIEYKDPVEFFARTYITEGMASLLIQALKRVAGKGGEPVIQLKTAFGGGKTHSMLALYHLLRGQVSIDKIPNVKPVLERAGLSSIVKTNVAVIVGTALDPSKSKKPPQYPGITINTLWGEMAAQLAGQAGDLKLYDYVKEADKKGVSPGSEALTRLFDACGPCLILIDELVAYARKIYGVTGLPAGSFENLISFVQELTEAARASKNSIVVASIPESDIEIGGEAGKIVLETIEHTFGRMEAIWKPVGANEGFEIVRRRLFLPPQDPASLEMVCRAFSEMYNQSTADFPLECKELEYYNRLKSCYPIHPEVFDRLYGDWATLERFQRTRGVLRLMAAVIHDLWMKNDGGLLIMPSSFSLDNPDIREELTRHLMNEGWNAVIDKEIDGKNSIPYAIDRKNPRFSKYLAARRVARTIMLGSAPSVREQRNRGIEVARIRLGVVQPGEQVSVFNDALSHLQNQLAYLYSDISNNRFWYDTRPTLRKTVEDRALQIPEPEVEYEIERRLKAIRERGEFAGVHSCPSSSLDIPDEQTVRLVVLAPEFTHKQGSDNSKAIEKAGEILNNRGASPRMYRNMLAFVAPDSEIIPSLISEVRKYLAWKSIIDDMESLNLDIAQQKEADKSLQRTDETVNLRIKEAYCWLLVPVQEGSNPIEWEKTRISGGSESHIIKASKKMVQMEQLIPRWSPALLRMELDSWLWKGEQHIQIKKLWEYLSSYCYLPRLKNVDVLLDCIKNGLSSDEYFAYAEGITGEGRYLSLKFNELSGYYYVDINGYLVRPEAAKAQIEKERHEKEKDAASAGITYTDGSKIVSTPAIKHPVTAGGVKTEVSGDDTKVQIPQQKKPRRFYATVKLDTSRIGRDAGRIAEEIVQHLNLLSGANVEVTMEIQAEFTNGVPDNVVRTVTENCRTLKFTNFAFEEE
ncbi:MAG TPA: ATP-binding protein [Clostridiaceae bacterium]|nr:ATP-binding protein [Clostridiaceae bacterium]